MNNNLNSTRGGWLCVMAFTGLVAMLGIGLAIIGYVLEYFKTYGK